MKSALTIRTAFLGWFRLAGSAWLAGCVVAASGVQAADQGLSGLDFEEVLARVEAGAARNDWRVVMELLDGIGQEHLDAPLGLKNNQGRWTTSLGAAVEERVASFSPEGRRAYALHYGPVAQARLDEAVAGEFDAEALDALQSRYLFTEAGQEAVDQLAAHYLDRFEPIPAMLYLERLLRDPALSPERRAEALIRLAVAAYYAGEDYRVRAFLQAWRKLRPTAFTPGGANAAFAAR